LPEAVRAMRDEMDRARARIARGAPAAP